jgi:hypothetical protein
VAGPGGCSSPPRASCPRARILRTKKSTRRRARSTRARAAGGERYATVEYTAATASLKSANEAVTQGDYRLALNHALESREHAQNAAREAADGKARTGAEVEREMAQIAALLAQASTRLTAAQRARGPARLRQPAPRSKLSMRWCKKRASRSRTMTI